MEKVLIAMSGGVDSSLAAKLMKDAGYECIGCTMKLYDNGDAGLAKGHTCCSLDDVEDARSVAHRIGIPYYVFNFKDGFRENVIKRFIGEYEAGRTPNPCIDCNRYMKFDTLFNRAQTLGCEYVVTGHYARIEKADGKYILKKALDETKDQSYVLYSMTQQQLAHTLFPLGSMKKPKCANLRKKADLSMPTNRTVRISVSSRMAITVPFWNDIPERPIPPVILSTRTEMFWGLTGGSSIIP